MIIKYGKGYAMEETTLMFCDFSEGVTDSKKIAQKREKWSMFFSIYEPGRKKVTLHCSFIEAVSTSRRSCPKPLLPQPRLVLST